MWSAWKRLRRRRRAATLRLVDQMRIEIAILQQQRDKAVAERDRYRAIALGDFRDVDEREIDRLTVERVSQWLASQEAR